MLSPVPVAVTIALTSVIGYLVGSVPVANLVARRRTGVDLRDVGDRNPGYWNAKEALGPRAALPVFAGDTLKGALAAAAGVALASDGEWWLAYVGGGAAMVGHAFPVFAGGRGGRSVLTFVGTAIVVSPVAAAVAVAVLAAVTIATRSFAFGARSGIVTFPIAQLVVDGPWRTAVTGVLMTFVGARFAQAALADRRRARELR